MQHAYCNVTIAPLRLEPTDKAEMISQILFAESIEIIEKTDKWSLVRTSADGYQGWMDTKQYELLVKPISYQHLVFNIHHSSQNQNDILPLVLGCPLPEFDGMQFKINKEKYVFNGSAIDIHNNQISNIKKVASKYLNAPYLWGGRSPFGIDCSGFTQMVYRFFNINLPRDAYQQATEGETINFVSETIIGDLAFFGNEERITHVGLVFDNNKIIHASGKVRIDTLDHIGIFNADTKKYTHFLKTIKRYM